MRKLVLIFLFAASVVSAAPGACPAGANYIDPTNPANGGGYGSVTLASLGVTGCYYISASGLDSNTGADEAHPWLHAPWMAACSGTCAVTPATGNGFIFRGGDTWHSNTGSPLIGASSMTLSQSGNSTNPIYVGIDIGWFSGGSFARPIFNQDNALSTAYVSSCTYPDDGNTFLNVTGSYVTLDGLEFTGHCLSSSGVSTTVNLSSGSNNHNNIERVYIHGWTTTNSIGDDRDAKIGSASDANRQNFNRIFFVVIDGQDSSLGAGCNDPSCIPQDGNGGSGGTGNTAVGWGIADGDDVEYTVIRHTSQGIQNGNTCIMIGDLFEYIFPPQFAGRHGNVVEAFQGTNGTSFCTIGLYYNNVTRYTNNGITWTPSAATHYYFNNVWMYSGHSYGTPPAIFDVNALMIGGLTNGSNTVVAAYLYNNTFHEANVQAPPVNSTTGGWGAGSTITWQNNHILQRTAPLTGGIWTCAGTCALTDHGGEVYQTIAAASSQGYTNTNTFAPTSSGGATVGHGLDATSFCSGIPGFEGVVAALPRAACASGTSQSVSEITAWGGKFAAYPAITVNARSVGSWDAGAYQYASGGSSSPAATPSISPATGTYTGAQTVTITDSSSGAAIYYTTDGSTPTTSSAVYSGAIAVSATTTVKAIASGGGYTASSVASSVITINVTSGLKHFSGRFHGVRF